VYSENSGFNVFSSAKFHHGHDSYNGFEIAHDGDYKGKVVEVLEDGSIVRPFDISITKNVLALLISLGLLLWIFLSVAKLYRNREGKAPKGIQSLLEPIIIFIRDDIAKASIGEKKYMKYLPFLLTLFFFIFLNNVLGLIPIFPGGANITGNIAITLVLALFTFAITTFSGNKNYWTHIINAPGVPWWLKIPIPLMPIVEIVGVFTKPFVLMVRLFANISAGHIIALGFFSLIFIFGNLSIYAGYGISVLSIAFTVFMTFLEFLVAFIQAYVFTLLSALYFGMAIEEHH
jgi:F-type H+-transporting ATPase subunit a